MIEPHYSDEWLDIYAGDAREVLSALPSESVDMVCTSPPYWGLRDYGTASWEGGDADCDHQPPRKQGDTGQRADRTFTAVEPYRDVCKKCGATRVDRQLGLERTPEEYVANMVAVFSEVRRVLKPTGTCWLNLGDSYAGSASQGGPSAKQQSNRGSWHDRERPMPPGLKPKDLVGIPWRVAFALQADGWYLRSDIIWSKPNPMPESVTDRPTKSHEYLFLLTKQPRYYFDADAVRETATWGEWNSSKSFSPNGQRAKMAVGVAGGEQWNGTGTHADENKSGRNIRSVWNIATVPYGNVKIGDAEGGHRDTLSPDCPVHSLRAIRRSLQTVGDDALLDHLRSRSPRSDSRPAPMPADGLFANLDLDSPGHDRSTPDSLPLGSSPEPILGSDPENRTPSPLTTADGLASDAGTDPRTSHTQAPTTDPGRAVTMGSPPATGRSGRGSRTSDESGPLGSASPEPESRTPDTGARPEGDDQPQSMDGSSSAGDSVGRDPDAQTTARTSGSCTCPDYSASHFAVFPPELPERCIKAGSSEKGVCPECGAPWERVVERHPMEVRPGPGREGMQASSTTATQRTSITGTMTKPASRKAVGWRPTCTHGAESVPSVVLDPFGGSGTTAMVANRLSRRAILIDLNPDYIDQQMRRNAQIPLGLGAA